MKQATYGNTNFDALNEKSKRPILFLSIIHLFTKNSTQLTPFSIKSKKMSESKPSSWSLTRSVNIEEKFGSLGLQEKEKDEFIIQTEQNIEKKIAEMKKQQADFDGRDKDEIYNRHQRLLEMEIRIKKRMLESYKWKLERKRRMAMVMSWKRYPLETEHFTKCVCFSFQNEGSH